MVIQTGTKHHQDYSPDSSANGVKSADRQKESTSKKSYMFKSPKENAVDTTPVYAYHEGPIFDMAKYSKSTSVPPVHHKKRAKPSSPKSKSDTIGVPGVGEGHHFVSKTQASQSTLEALMAREPVSHDQVVVAPDRGSPVGSFHPMSQQTKSASLSRDISPSRITAQVVSALSESPSYAPPLLHSALTGKLTQSPATSPSPPSRTVIRGGAGGGDHDKLSSQTIKHLQGVAGVAGLPQRGAGHSHILQQTLQIGKEGVGGPPVRPVSPWSSQLMQLHHDAADKGAFRSASPRSKVLAAHGLESEKGVSASYRSVSPSGGHLFQQRGHKDESGGIVLPRSVSEALGFSTISSVAHVSDISVPVYTSSVVNSTPTTMVYSHSGVRGPSVPSIGLVSGSISSVRAAPPGVRIVGPPLDNPGFMPRELADRIDAEYYQAALKRAQSPGPPPTSRQPKEHLPSSYPRHPSSTAQTIRVVAAPSHGGHISQGPPPGHRSVSPHAGHRSVSPHAGHRSVSPHAGQRSVSPHAVHRSVSPHAGHRGQGHVSPVPASQSAQGKVSPAPVGSYRVQTTVLVPHSQGRVSPGPQGGHRSHSPASAHRGHHGHVSPVEMTEHQQISSPPPAHKHPELPPTCRSVQRAVDLTKTHHSTAPSVAYSLAHAAAASAALSAQGHVNVGLPKFKMHPQSRKEEVLDVDVRQISQPPAPHPHPPPHYSSSSTQQSFIPHHLPVHSSQTKGVVLPRHVNPFTFPATATVSHGPEPVSSHVAGTGRGSELSGNNTTPNTAPFSVRSVSDASEIKRVYTASKDGSHEMPRLLPEVPLIKAEEDERTFVAFNHVGQMSEGGRNDTSALCPFNMRLHNLANFPVNNTTYRSGYRAHSMAVQRAKACSITSAAKSLDILRQNLQKCMTREIDKVVQNYMDKFFKPAIENIRLNNGQAAVSDDHIHSVCRQILEEAKRVYVSDTPRRSVTPDRIDDAVSETGSNGGRRPLVIGRRRRGSDSNSEAGSDISSKEKKRRKGRPPLSVGRGGSMKAVKPSEPVKREGPKWDPARLTAETKFVMGARANKALGLGATRGRLYIKHPDVFKYSGDQDDKAWLYEHCLMPATGGKAYMLLVEDIQDLSQSDEYKSSPNLLMDELYGFTVPDWVLSKMKIQMNAMRTDYGRSTKFQRSRSGTPTDPLTSYGEMDEEQPKTLPFSNFTDSSTTYPLTKPDSQASPSDMEYLSTADNDDSAAPDLSPFNVTGGFDDTTPSPPEVDNLDDPTFVLK